MSAMSGHFTTGDSTTLRWGILATGDIAQTFTKDLLRPPSARGVSDVRHVVVAAASSTSAERAQAFLRETDCPSDARAYGSYAELAADLDVQIIYVATPHSHHYQNVMLCLHAGKHVLCEKALTANAAQARALIGEAEKRGLFFMEAVWIRFFPITRTLRDMVAAGVIGAVRCVTADFGLAKDMDTLELTSRLLNPDLAGGALLDLGVYPITWIFQFLYHIVPADKRETPKVAAAMTLHPRTGVDETTAVVLSFPGAGAQGVATASLRLRSDPARGTGRPGAITPVRIQGDRGEIQVISGGTMPAVCRPTQFRVVPYPAGDRRAVAEEVVDMPPPDGGHGMFWEADECARCIRDGKLQSETMGWAESIAVMDVLDEARRQGGLRFPDKVETLEYPVEIM